MDKLAHLGSTADASMSVAGAAWISRSTELLAAAGMIGLLGARFLVVNPCRVFAGFEKEKPAVFISELEGRCMNHGDVTTGGS